MAPDVLLKIEVVYATPAEQAIVELSVPPGTTAAQAVERSGLAQRFPGIGPAAKLGVFGRVVAPDAPVSDGDRVEIYRPLVADPKQARVERATGTSPKR